MELHDKTNVITLNVQFIFSKRLSENRHHCHIKKGQPTYVTIWEVTNKRIKLIEVTYAGTHEKAPY